MTDLGEVKAYWENHVHDWRVAESPIGTPDFFQEVEAYRFRKLEYLDELLLWLLPTDQEESVKILDAGCGVATELARLHQRYPQLECVGVDLTANAIRLAQSNFSSRGLKGAFEEMNAEELSFPDEHFQSVYCHSTLQFTTDPQRVISELERVLQPGGRAVIMMENRNSWLNILRRLTGAKVDNEDAPVFHRVSLSEFDELLHCFPNRKVYADRPPVYSEARKGLKGLLFNHIFLPLISFLPRAWVDPLGHHLIARIVKSSD